MILFKRFSLWISREIRLYRLKREVEARQQVWLSTRLLQKHPNEQARHRASSLAVLEYLHAAEAYEKGKKNCEF